jgi:hypothetical protein
MPCNQLLQQHRIHLYLIKEVSSENSKLYIKTEQIHVFLKCNQLYFSLRIINPIILFLVEKSLGNINCLLA